MYSESPNLYAPPDPADRSILGILSSWPLLSRAALVLLLLLSFALAATGIDDPLSTIWREHDIAAVARNFYEEGMNPLYPRIDWRGNGPGFAEMEFPLQSWLMALTYHFTGIHISIGRLFSFLFFVLSTLGLVALSVRRLPPVSALIAITAFALNPLIQQTSTELRPELAMLAAYIAAIFFFDRWLTNGANRDFLLASSLTAAAILLKAPAIHIGLLYAPLLLRRYGVAAFRNLKLWGFAAICLIAPAAWYLHAHNLWLTYGNSLGVSNQYHWIGTDILNYPHLFTGAASHLLDVFRPFGLFLAAFGLISFRRDRIRLESVWLFALLVYFIATIRSTGGAWAYAYYVVAVPAAALLIGHGVRYLIHDAPARVRPRILLLALPALGVAFYGLARLVPQSYLPAAPSTIALAFFTAMVLLVALPFIRVTTHEPPLLRSHKSRFAASALACVLASLLVVDSARRTWWQVPGSTTHALERCSRQFQQHVPEDALIIATGGSCVSNGRPAAYNVPYFFYWIDRQGYNICETEQTLERVRALANSGARYFVVEYARLVNPTFLTSLLERFPIAAECEDALLLELPPSTEAATTVRGSSDICNSGAKLTLRENDHSH